MKRIQRKRVKGWKMPPNTVYVGRPTKWGNPYKMTSILAADAISREESVRRYEIWIRKRLEENPSFLDALKGKDLACWCPLDKPCHADVILRVLELAKSHGRVDTGSHPSVPASSLKPPHISPVKAAGARDPKPTQTEQQICKRCGKPSDCLCPVEGYCPQCHIIVFGDT